MIYWVKRSKKEENRVYTRAKPIVTIVLEILVVILTVVLAVTTVLSIPYFQGGPASAAANPPVTQPPTEPPTEPTEPPTEPEPTLPPPDPNPYGPLDFQYDGRYLKLREGDCTVGIDISYHQKDIDFEQVKASGVEFVMIRIAYRGYEQGGLIEDKHARTYLEQAAEAGLDIGVYFFSQAITPEEAEEEAYFVLNYLEEYKDRITMPVVYDWETVSAANARTKGMTRRNLTECSKAFLETIENAGYWPMLYFNRRQSEKLLYLEELKDYDFWLAAYTDRMRFPYKIKMWQYTESGSVPGVDGGCDINIFFPGV